MAVSDHGGEQQPTPTEGETEGDERTEKPTGRRRDTMEVGRVLALSDGVLAIAATLLVLDLRVPDGLDAAGVNQTLRELRPAIGGYALSYVLIGVTWIAHHKLFRLISPVTDRMARLNLLFLGTVSVYPFVTSLIARYGDQRLPTALYALVSGTIFLLELAMLGLARRERHLLDLPAARPFAFRAAASAAVFLVSAGIAAIPADWSASAAKYSWLALIPARLVASVPGFRRQRGSPR